MRPLALVRPHSRDLSTATSGISSGGPKPCSTSQRTFEQASQRPPRADQVAVDVGAVAGDDVVKVLLVSEREGGEVEQRVALGRLGPVDDAGDLVTVDEDVVDLQVAVDEHRRPRPERSLGEPAVARDHVGGKDVVGDEPLALAGELRCELVDGSDRAMAAAARRAASGRRHPPRPTPPTTRSTARRDGRVPSPGGRRARARAASATGSPESGPAPSPSPRPRRRCASDQRRSSGTRRRRAGSRARDGRRRPRSSPRRPSSRPDHRRRRE